MHFPELTLLKKLTEDLAAYARVRDHGTIRCRDQELPLISLSLGTTDPQAPVLAISGGVHGLERIGSQVALAFLSYISERLKWDATLHWELERMRLVFFPIVNPGGMLMRSRCNLNGVDLNRNSPVDGDDPTWLVGGHRISPKLPWYRGALGAPMESEAQALVDFVRDESIQSSITLWLDCHSGFGIRDRLWYPWAKSKTEFPRQREMDQLKRLMDATYPHHVYIIESQAKNYTTHGDLLDYAFANHARENPSGVFLPLTLEMGSWNWLKKNPLQGLSYLGYFNPTREHRVRRTLRRHLPLFDFLMRSLISKHPWWK